MLNLLSPDPMTHLNRRTFLQGTALLGMSQLFSCSARADQHVWRVAAIGLTGQGDFGHDLDTMWLNLPQTKVVAVADSNADGLQKAVDRLKGATGYANYHDMLTKEKPDIVAVCPRWIGEHRHEMLLAAINSGAKGVYCEKPFVSSPADADDVVAACQKTGCKLAIAHRNRYHPALPVVKQLIKAGEIGQILEIRGRGKEDQRGGGQDLWVLGSHVIDMARYFFGNALDCTAMLFQGDRPATPADVIEGAEGVGLIAGDRLHARFEMENGIPFYFDSIKDAGQPRAGFGLQIIGNKGVINLRMDVDPIAYLTQGNPFDSKNAPAKPVLISSAGVGQPEPDADLLKKLRDHRPAALDLIAAIENNQKPLCSEIDGQATTEMIAAVFASHVAGGNRVTFPLSDRGLPLKNWKLAE